MGVCMVFVGACVDEIEMDFSLGGRMVGYDVQL